MTTYPSDSSSIDVVWIETDWTEQQMYYWDGKEFFARCEWVARDRLVSRPILEPDFLTKAAQLEQDMPKVIRHIDSKSKRGRQLNSRKFKWGGKSYRGQPTGAKELERGVRSYMVYTYPDGSRRPGHGIVQTMSKKQYDAQVSYTEGE